MTIVLVHGNPEVAAIWDDLLAELASDGVDRTVVTLSPPGFGAPVPAGFGSTAGEYADWLVAELESIGEPVDLIGHDWGAGHAIHTLVRRPDLMASVTIDIAGIFAPGYVWHDMAQLWRTPDVGEETVAGMVAVPRGERIAMFTGLGMSAAAAAACADAVADMGPSILALYRSADEEVLAEAGRVVAAMPERPPMHVIVATDDHYAGGEPLADVAAEMWNATVHRLDGLGHWWMMQDPERGAAVVRSITDRPTG